MRGRALLLAVPLAAALVRPGGAAMAFELESSAFKAGETIPRKHTCDGQDLSPPLAWTDPPPGTKSFALVCDDPDAPAGTWVHWVLYGVPASATGLPEGVRPAPTLDDGSRQGTNDFRRTGYGGARSPPRAAHPHYLMLYALGARPPPSPRAAQAAVLEGIRGRTRRPAQPVGRFSP